MKKTEKGKDSPTLGELAAHCTGPGTAQNYNAFFTGDRIHLFRPLVRKSRELALACLKALYARMHGPEADYGTPITREYVRDVFALQVHQVPVTADSDDPPDAGDEALSAKDEVAAANVLLREFIACGWMEKHSDKGAMVTTYRFTRTGKALVEAFVYMDERSLSTRHRNVRNVRNALEQYVRAQDPDNLVDAVDYAQRVVSDISQDIDDLEQRKADLMREAAARQASSALDEFIKYMATVFAPDLAKRFSTDSVERHRYRIEQLVEEIYGWPRERLTLADQRLRASYPTVEIRAGESPVIRLLDRLRGAIDLASETKMPELREALRGFVNRTHIVIQYATSMNENEARGVNSLLKRLAKLNSDAQDRALSRISTILTPFQPALPDPGFIRLRQRMPRRVIQQTTTLPELTEEERLNVALAQAEDTAFTVSLPEIHGYIIEQMGEGHLIHSRNLVVSDATSLLALSHAIEAGGVSAEGAPPINVRPSSDGKARYSNPYLEADDFELRRD